MSHPDYHNHPGHADHDPALTSDFQTPADLERALRRLIPDDAFDYTPDFSNDPAPEILAPSAGYITGWLREVTHLRIALDDVIRERDALRQRIATAEGPGNELRSKFLRAERDRAELTDIAVSLTLENRQLRAKLYPTLEAPTDLDPLPL